MSAPAPPRVFPGPLQASLLVLLGAFLTSLVVITLAPLVTMTAAIGLASVLGLGAAGALGATSVPPPHAERVGLRGLRMRHLPGLLLLLPIALVASEVDNMAQAFFPAPDAQQITEQAIGRLPTDTGLALLETLVVVVGLVPVIEEWFFRGVIQQGLVASLGSAGGVGFTALLFAFGHGAPGLSAQSWVAAVAQAFVLGAVFGWARHATGSLLASIGLHVGVNLSGVLGLALAGSVPIAGYNAPGAHTPLRILAPALAAVLVGAWWLGREPAPEVPEAPEPERSLPDEDDE